MTRKTVDPWTVGCHKLMFLVVVSVTGQSTDCSCRSQSNSNLTVLGDSSYNHESSVLRMVINLRGTGNSYPPVLIKVMKGSTVWSSSSLFEKIYFRSKTRCNWKLLSFFNIFLFFTFTLNGWYVYHMYMLSEWYVFIYFIWFNKTIIP